MVAPPPHHLVAFLQSNSPATVFSTLYLSNLPSGQLSLSPYQPASFPFSFLKRATILWHLLGLLLPEAMTVSDSYASRMKAKIVPSPEYYVQRRRQLEKSIIQKRHAVSTKNNIEYIKRRWIK